jgi:hypothetical protein
MLPAAPSSGVDSGAYCFIREIGRVTAYGFIQQRVNVSWGRRVIGFGWIAAGNRTQRLRGSAVDSLAAELPFFETGLAGSCGACVVMVAF